MSRLRRQKIQAIEEANKKVLNEQSLMDKLMNQKDKVGDFLNARHQIEKKAYQIYDTITPNPKIKEDAFAHQTASAYAQSLFGTSITELLGFLNEVQGGLRMFFRGTSVTPKYTRYTSDYTMDMKNNAEGIKIAQDNPNKTLDEYYKLVQDNIDSGNYYDKAGNLP